MHSPVSLNLKRHGDSQTVIGWAFLFISICHWISAKLSETPMMPREVYGDWVVSIDAEIWASSLMAASTLLLVGVRINGDWRWSPALRFIGSLWHCVTLFAFAVGAFGTQYGDFFVVATGSFGAIFAWFACLNYSDLLRAVRNDRS